MFVISEKTCNLVTLIAVVLQNPYNQSLPILSY